MRITSREVNLQPRFCALCLLCTHSLWASAFLFKRISLDGFHPRRCETRHLSGSKHWSTQSSKIGLTLCFLTHLPQDSCNLASNFETQRMQKNDEKRWFFYPALFHYDETNALRSSCHGYILRDLDRLDPKLQPPARNRGWNLLIASHSKPLHLTPTLHLVRS